MLVLTLFFAGITYAKISPCKNDTNQLNLCFHGGEYDTGLGSASPTFVEVKMKLQEIAAFNNYDKSITMSIGIKVIWNDTRFTLQAPKE